MLYECVFCRLQPFFAIIPVGFAGVFSHFVASVGITLSASHRMDEPESRSFTVANQSIVYCMNPERIISHSAGHNINADMYERLLFKCQFKNP